MSRANTPFDEYAHHYDTWFLKNRNVLQSEVLLLKRFLDNPGRALSVGCGSGLFEHILRGEHGIDISHGVEPAEGMARIAAKRGMNVKPGTAEHLPSEDNEFDTVLLNGITGYVDDLGPVFGEAARVLKQGGRIVVADVPAESSYGLLYALVGHIGSWDVPSLTNVAPAHAYPAEFVGRARWRTTGEKAEVLRSAGFVDLEFAQTLTRHPKYSNDSVEEPIDGFDRGDYVAIRGRKA
ncbi:MAG: class I SAM-dependent methyltransferase [Gemmatimonadota bacterium]